MDMEDPDLWKSFKDGVWNACDKLCGKYLNTWRHAAHCKNPSENSLAKYKALKNKAKKMVVKATKDKAEREIENVGGIPITS